MYKCWYAYSNKDQAPLIVIAPAKINGFKVQVLAKAQVIFETNPMTMEDATELCRNNQQPGGHIPEPQHHGGLGLWIAKL